MSNFVQVTCFALYCLLTIQCCFSQSENVEPILDYEYANDLYGEASEVVRTQNTQSPTSNSTDGHEDTIDMVETSEEASWLTPVARSLHDFSFDMFNALHSGGNQEKNIVISPLSLYTTLMMLRPGLSSGSLAQVDDVLGWNLLSSDNVGSLLDVIYKENPTYKLRYASRVYFDNSVKLRKSYKQDLKRLSVVQTRRTDFAGHPRRSRSKMNRYVRNRTKKLINELVPEGAVDANTRLYLVNALYLKAKWNFQFSKAMTRMRSFHLEGKNTIKVPTMKAKHSICTLVRHKALQADVAVLSLGGDLSMMFVMPLLPGNFSGFYDGTRQMKTKFASLFNEIWPAEDDGERYLEICSVTMPKFRVQFEDDLVSALKRMGITDIFDAHTADLSRMTQRNNGLYVGDVRHKAVLEANEGGIEAAAATSLGIQIRSAGPGTHVEVDRPFMFAVRHDKTGAILFLGKVVRPDAF